MPAMSWHVLALVNHASGDLACIQGHASYVLVVLCCHTQSNDTSSFVIQQW